MNSWFTIKVKYTRQLENGTFKRVSEPYLVAAMTFTDAEARIYEELGSLIRGEFMVTGINRSDFHDIYHYEDVDTWYKCKITYELCDGESSKAKKTSQTFLVTAHTVKEASERLKESLSGMMIDYVIKSVVESPLVDVFPFGDDEEKTERVAGKYSGIVSAKVLADMIGEAEYRSELSEEQISFAQDNGLVVVYGASDDLTMINNGFEKDEQGIGDLYFDDQFNFFREDELSRDQKDSLNYMYVRQCPFSVETKIPHATFPIMEDGELYGTGIILSIKDLK